MKDMDEKYLKQIYFNILKAIIFVAYFLILNIVYQNISEEVMEKVIQYFTMITLFISICIFEVAYKKDDGFLVIKGIEILILSIFTLTAKHITNRYNFNFNSYLLVGAYTYAIYYVLKGIIAYTKGKKEEAKKFSDIREIVKKEQPVKREAVKRRKR